MFLRYALTCILFASIAMAQAGDDAAVVYARRIIASEKTYNPTAGYVPDSDTAIGIAKAVLTPIYGKADIDAEKPWHTGLKAPSMGQEPEVAAGIAGAAAGNLTTQVLNHFTRGCDYSATNFATSVAMGAVAGLFPTFPIAGVITETNSLTGVFNQMVTKLERGEISTVSTNTASQMFLGRAGQTGLLPGVLMLTVGGTIGQPSGATCGCK